MDIAKNFCHERATVSPFYLLLSSVSHKEDLFTPKDLLNLLITRGTVSNVSDKEYVMPALMPHLDDLKVPKCHQDITPLIISPFIGCIPSGLFCRLMAHLLSTSNKFNWKVGWYVTTKTCVPQQCFVCATQCQSNSDFS